MPRLSDKYIAGFFDADGSVYIKMSGANKMAVTLSFSQKTDKDKVLLLIQQALDGFGYIREKKVKNTFYSELVIYGSKASMVLNRIKKHLIIKRHYAECVLDAVARQTPETIGELRQWLKEQRKVRSLPLPNYPPRKWMAGYVDGDGSFVTVVRYKGAAEFKLSIGAWIYDTEGIELIHKAFGGLNNKQSDTFYLWSVGLPPSKAKKVLDHFAKYLIIKRDQAYFILGCAAMGNYRDGKNIKAAMKQLKAHPHRLSEPEIDVSKLVSGIKDLPWYKRDR